MGIDLDGAAYGRSYIRPRYVAVAALSGCAGMLWPLSTVMWLSLAIGAIAASSIALFACHVTTCAGQRMEHGGGHLPPERWLEFRPLGLRIRDACGWTVRMVFYPMIAGFAIMVITVVIVGAGNGASAESTPFFVGAFAAILGWGIAFNLDTRSIHMRLQAGIERMIVA